MNQLLRELLGDIDTDRTLKSISNIKAESILSACGKNHNPSLNETYLCIGPNIVAHGLDNLGYAVSAFHGLGSEYKFCNKGIELSSDMTLKELAVSEVQYDYVIAPDEWLVYADSEQDQIERIRTALGLARRGFITTLKDYKNMHANQRFFQEPFELKTNTGSSIILRKREWDSADRQAWLDKTILIKNNSKLQTWTQNCRTMYFKQFAKFATDAGAQGFAVEKKIQYKPLFSKSFEYIIYVATA